MYVHIHTCIYTYLSLSLYIYIYIYIYIHIYTHTYFSKHHTSLSWLAGGSCGPRTLHPTLQATLALLNTMQHNNVCIYIYIYI